MTGLGGDAFGAFPFGGEGDDNTERVADGIGVSAAADVRWLIAVREFMVANAAADEHVEITVHATAHLAVGDLAAIVHRALVQEGFALAATPAAQFTAMTIVADALRLSGVASNRVEAYQLVTVGIAFAALADSWLKLDAHDTVALQGAVADALQAAQRVVDGILAGATPTNSVLFGVVVSEAIAASAEAGNHLEAHEAIRDGVALALRLNVEGDERIAYVINTESKATTRFTQWPFNSYAQLGATKHYYGMTPDGIRRIFDGEATDDGAAIGARIRLSMTNLGTGRLKRMQAAYLGYTATGELRLKAVVVAEDGKKAAYTYRLRAQGAEAMRPARIGIGQGLKSVYWGFELEAIDGAAFEIDLLDLLPLVLDGRVDGEGGGRR